MKRIALVLFSLTVLTPTALAATLQEGDAFTLTTPLKDDYYGGGRDITLNQSIEGDAVLFGGNIRIQERVSEDVITAGGNIDVNAPVGDDARVAGGTIRMMSSVGGDVLVAGGTVELLESFTSSGDVLVVGGDIVINGLIRGNLKVRGGKIALHGTVLGDTEIQGGELTLRGRIDGKATLAADTISVEPSARFGENIEYWRKDGEMTFPVSGSGNAIFIESLRPTPDASTATGFVAALYGAFTLFSIFSTALIVGLLIFMNRTYFDDAGRQFRDAPEWNLLYGLIYLIAGPVIILLFMATVFGIPIALLLLGLYAASLFFLPAASALIIAKTLGQYYHKQWGRGTIFLVSMGVYIVLRFIGAVPIIGWLAKAIVLLIALGTLVIVKWERIKKIV